VIMAIVLDRLTSAASERVDLRDAGGPAARFSRRAIVLGAIAVTVGAALLGSFVLGGSDFPDAVRISFADPVNAITKWVERNLFARFLRPLLDAAQTMPSFVYLLPALALFGATRFTAIVAAVIYAAPPVIRLVEDGIRGVPPTVIEAATSAGTTERQLLWKVQ